LEPVRLKGFVYKEAGEGESNKEDSFLEEVELKVELREKREFTW